MQKYPAQFCDIPPQIADDARDAAVKTKGGENHRNGRQGQALLNRQRQQVHLMNVRHQQGQHNHQEDDFGAKQEAIDRFTSAVPMHTTAPPRRVKISTPAAGGSCQSSHWLRLEASNSPAPLI